MTATKRTCSDCDRSLVTVAMLAAAHHSGCALLRHHHQLDECPNKKAHEIAAMQLWKHMDRQVREDKNGG